MSFLFKSKKQGGGLPSVSRKLTSADGSNASLQYARPDTSITGSPSSVTTNNSTMRRVQSPTPEPVNIHTEQSISSLRSAAVSPPRPAPETSLYPWSQQHLQFVTAQSNPFPRYGAALNAVASREGDIYMMGGLINGVTVKGDLWIVEGGSGSLNCYPVQTTAEGPGARVGHASLLVGNAFIVFGGDTKLNETDPLDDTLYLLNTSTKHWSRALPPGHRPAGRYGHTLNILGSKIYVFGGQVEGYFFNDLVAFDLNALQQANSRWETLIQNTNDGGPPVGQIPPARTNHTIITYNDKLYLFGGTDGVRWFNDVWTYDQRSNSWTAQECIGFIPSAREGHAAALVGDVMYVFGGRTEEGKDLGDLAAFRIPTRRWYTFQNMGPSPSPRSGHGLTAFGDKIVVLAGEPSSAPRDPSELSLVYTLDTTKIRYPTDQASTRSMNASRRPSTTERSQTPQTDRSSSRNGDYGPNGAKLLKQGSQESLSSNLDQPQKPADNASANGFAASGPFQKAFRSPSVTALNTAQQPLQLRTNGVAPQSDGQTLPRLNGAKMGNMRSESAASLRDPVTLVTNPSQRDLASATSPTFPSTPVMAGQFTRSKSPQSVNNYSPMASNDKTSASQKQIPTNNFPRSFSQQSQRPKQSLDLASRGPNQSLDLGKGSNGTTDSGPRPAQTDAAPSLDRPVTTKILDSGLGSSPAITTRNEELVKELEAARSRNAWFASELALARKLGYQPSTTDATVSDARTAEAFGDHEKPLLEALLRMRAEIAKVQGSLATQSAMAAEKIAQVAKERDTALSEAASSRTRLVAYGWKGTAGSDMPRHIALPETERSEDASRRLASALAAQTELSSRMRSLAKEVESERKARQLAEESADLALNRATELDIQKQGTTTEIETLRTELLEAQKAAREALATSSEALASSEMLQVDKNELTGKLNAAQENEKTHDSVLSSLRDAVVSSADKAALLERKLEYEKRLRSSMEDKLVKLRAEHETRVAELETTTSRLRDAEELADSHANEARTHRDAVLAGLGQRSESRIGDNSANDERVNILQQRVEAANAMVRRNQEAADRAAERLRRAEERVAGLESSQEQTSREGINFRKQLQLVSREALSLRSENADLQQRLASTKLDSTALQVQHSALKSLLNERGIDGSGSLQDRSVNSTANPERFYELERQLDASNRAREDMRASFEQREQEANKGWENKLAALDSDYQAAVKYLKGTEKMLGKMKTELHRYKAQNKDLEDELLLSRPNSTSREAPVEWTNERSTLYSEIDRLQGRVQQSSAQLESHMQDLRSAGAERDAARESNTRLHQDLERYRGDLDGLRRHNSILEAKAAEAERKVQMLLDTVGTTVGNYRRDSQMPIGHGHGRGLSVNSVGGDSLYSFGGDGAHDGQGGTLPSLEEVAGRNSVALDSLASELETLRSRWETTNKAYRSGGPSELDGNAVAGHTGSLTHGEASAAPLDENLANWKAKLEMGAMEGLAGRTEAGGEMRQGA